MQHNQKKFCHDQGGEMMQKRKASNKEKAKMYARILLGVLVVALVAVLAASAVMPLV